MAINVLVQTGNWKQEYGKIDCFRNNIALREDASQKKCEKFIIDSGATHHMYGVPKLFRTIQTVPEYKITLGDNTQVTGNRMGEIHLEVVEKNGSKNMFRLAAVLLLENIALNLLSMSSFDDHGIDSLLGNRQ